MIALRLLAPALAQLAQWHYYLLLPGLRDIAQRIAALVGADNLPAFQPGSAKQQAHIRSLRLQQQARGLDARALIQCFGESPQVSRHGAFRVSLKGLW